MVYQTDELARLRRQRSEQAIKAALQSRWDEAVQLNQQIIELTQGRDGDAFNRLGRALMAIGRYRDAREAYGRALQIDPTNQIARKNYASLQQKAQDIRDSIAANDRASKDVAQQSSPPSGQRQLNQKMVEDFKRAADEQAAKLGGAGAVSHWGHGYALDATRTIIDFGFTTLGLHRISAAIGPDNAASIAIVTRLGFTEEGQLRDHVFTNGAWRDSILYSLLTHEWLHDGQTAPDI